MVLLVMTVFTLVNLGRRLPLQNVVTIAVLLLTMSLFIQFVAKKMGLPFKTSFRLSTGALLWLMLIINGRILAKWLLQKTGATHNFGFKLLGLATLFAGTGYFLMDSLHTRGFRFINLPGEYFIALCFLVCITPWMIDKKPQP